MYSFLIFVYSLYFVSILFPILSILITANYLFNKNKVSKRRYKKALVIFIILGVVLTIYDLVIGFNLAAGKSKLDWVF